MTDYKTLYDAIVNLNIPIEKQGKFANDKDLWFEYAHFPYIGKSNQSDIVDINTPLTFEAMVDGTKIYFCTYNSVNPLTIEASVDDGKTWQSYTQPIPESAPESPEDIFPLIATLNTGQKVMVRGDNPDGMCPGDPEEALPHFFHAEGKAYVYGNVMSLLSKDSFATITSVPVSAFAHLFHDPNEFWQTSLDWLFSHPENKLILPATTLAESCYLSMFFNCANLTSAPELPAKTLAEDCYGEMFAGCTSLLTAPELPATTLAEHCYNQMFFGCSSLTSAPELPAITLVEGCYNGMFYECSSLNYIKAMFTTTPSMTYTSSWVLSVSATGTFVKNPEATWNVTGLDGIPTGWTVETA